MIWHILRKACESQKNLLVYKKKSHRKIGKFIQILE